MKYTVEKIIKMKPKMAEMLKYSDLGAMLQFRKILAIPEAEMEERLDEINHLMNTIPSYTVRLMKMKYDFDVTAED